MNTEQRRLAARMWKDGALVTEIARTFGVKVNRVYHLADRYRHEFPHRQFTCRRREKDIPPPPVHKPTSRGMPWTTESGAHVTLARVTIISCPRGDA